MMGNTLKKKDMFAPLEVEKKSRVFYEFSLKKIYLFWENVI